MCVCTCVCVCFVSTGWMAWKHVLSTDHLRGLKDHKYSAQGISILEVFLQPFWRKVVEFVPLWVAPNLLTFTGLLINVVTTLLVVLLDLKAEGKVRQVLLFIDYFYKFW